jgi:hypothetical protein
VEPLLVVTVPSRLPRRRRALVVLLAALALPCPSAGAAEPWTGLAHRIAEPWPALQQADGRFADSVNGGRPMPQTRYADSMLGYGLLLSGLHGGEREHVDAGLRAITWATSRPWGDNGGPSVFETLALAGAYRLARARLHDDPAFVALRPQ